MMRALFASPSTSATALFSGDIDAIRHFLRLRHLLAHYTRHWARRRRCRIHRREMTLFLLQHDARLRIREPRGKRARAINYRTDGQPGYNIITSIADNAATAHWLAD